MKKEKVEDWLEKNQRKTGMVNPAIESRKSGESNHNFVVKSGDEKYILRVSRDISRENRLENEAEKLNFLQHEGIEFVPESVFFGKETRMGSVLIETFVGEQDLDSENMTDLRLQSLAERIAKVHSIPVEHYNSYADRDEDAKISLKKVFRNDFRKWSKKPYEEYLKNAEEADPRIKKFFEKQKKLLDAVPDTEVERGPVHGDLGFNIRATGKDVFIVDWEFCRIDFPENEILYCFEHEDLSQRQRRVFLEEYQKHRELSHIFSSLREIYPGFLAFNDAIWAANRVILEPEKEEEHRKRLENKLEKLQRFHRD